jgi:hypothetical protein
MIATVSSRSPLTDRTYHSDRRAHVRLKPTAVPWLRGARLRYGCDVHVIDISATGIQVESTKPLKSGASVVFELSGETNTVVVPARVVRCRESVVRDQVRYRAACSFTAPLVVPVAGSETSTEESQAVQTVDDIAYALESPPAVEGSGSPETDTPKSASQKIVAKYRDGRTLRGHTNNFHAARPQLHIFKEPNGGESVYVPVAQLKAIFFVRTFDGDPSHIEGTTFASRAGGRKLEVTFHDDEVLVGSTLSYRHDGEGFFIYPADQESNNLRVFVVLGAVRHLRFL